MTGFCAIVTNSHLPYARVLTESLRLHNPDAQVFILLADEPVPGHDFTKEPFTVVTLPQLGHADEIRRMSFYYTVFEFCCALRPFIHAYLMRETKLDTWFFLDSDVLITGSFEGVWEGGGAILLTPHLFRSGDIEMERILLRAGAYNGGVVGLRRGAEAERFIGWYLSRLKENCFFDLKEGLFVDQLWLNLVPIFFDTHVSRLPGLNVAYWNAIERNLRVDGKGGFSVDGCPLIFFHFSGWNPLMPERLSLHCPAGNPIDGVAWDALHRRYLDLLNKAGLNSTPAPYAFGLFSDGTPMDSRMRRLFFRELKNGTYPGGDPFDRRVYFEALLRSAEPKRRAGFLRTLLGRIKGA